MNKIKLPKHLKTVALASILALIGNTQDSLAEALDAEPHKQTAQELEMSGKLEKFKSLGYDCIVLPQEEIQQEGNVIDADGFFTDADEHLIEGLLDTVSKKNNVKIMLVNKSGIAEDGNILDFAKNFSHCLSMGMDDNNKNIIINFDKLDNKSFMSFGPGLRGEITAEDMIKIAEKANHSFSQGDIKESLISTIDMIDYYIKWGEYSEFNDKYGIKKYVKENKMDLLSYAIITILIMGFAGLTYSVSYLKKQKKIYDKIVKDFNMNKQKLLERKANTDKKFKECNGKFEKTCEEIDFEHFSWAKYIFDDLEEKLLFLKESINELEEKPNLSKYANSKYKTFKGSWTHYLGDGDVKMKQEIETDKEIAKSLGKIELSLMELTGLVDSSFETFTNLKKIDNLVLRLGDVMNEYTIYLEIADQKGFNLQAQKNNINEMLQNIEDLLEDLDNMMEGMKEGKISSKLVISLFEDIVEEKKNLDDTFKALVSYVDSYESLPIKIGNKMIDRGLLATFDKEFQLLEKLVPVNILEQFKSKKSDLEGFISQQTELKKEFDDAYEKKDLDILISVYKEYISCYNNSESISKLLSETLKKQNLAKKKVTTITKAGDKILKEARRKMTSENYDIFQERADIYKKLLKKSRVEKADWVSLLSSFEDTAKYFKEIINNVNPMKSAMLR